MAWKDKEKQRQAMQRYYNKYPDKARKRARDWYRAHSLEVQRKQKIAAQILKAAVLGHYSFNGGVAACVICKEQRLACLSIDHIANDGYQERKLYNHRGTRLYQKLRRENFPDGYQTLCMNCQFVKSQDSRTTKEGLDGWPT